MKACVSGRTARDERNARIRAKGLRELLISDKAVDRSNEYVETDICDRQNRIPDRLMTPVCFDRSRFTADIRVNTDQQHRLLSTKRRTHRAAKLVHGKIYFRPYILGTSFDSFPLNVRTLYRSRLRYNSNLCGKFRLGIAIEGTSVNAFRCPPTHVYRLRLDGYRPCD